MMILNYLQMMWRFSKSRSLVFASLLLLSSLTEGFGLVILVPLLGTLHQTVPEKSGFVGTVMEGLSSAGIPITLVGLLCVFLVLNFARAIIKYGQAVMSERFRMELLDDLRTRSFDAMLEANWEWLVTQKKSDMSNLLINEINRLGTALLFSVRFIVSVFSIAAYVLVALALSFGLTLLALAFGTVLLFAMRRQHSIANDHGKLLSDASGRVQQTIEEGLTGLKLLKILRSENRQSELMAGMRSVMRNRSLQFIRLNAGMTFIFQILVAISMAAFLYVGVESLDLSLPTLLILVLIFSRLAPQIREVQTQINNILHSGAALQNYDRLLQQAGNAREGTFSQNQTKSLSFGSSIKLSNVSYSYQSRDKPSLFGVNISIPQGKTTAITGTSGAGKSTLADLVMGLLIPNSGSIEVDGLELNEQNRLAWRKSIAYMSQEVFLFHDTIQNNLLWAEPTARTEDLETALRQASAEFVFDLPDGLNTVVGDAGQRLSGGEKQRIALARAMLQKPQLLILDEATSELDIENESRIRDTIDKLQNEMTVIVIGHRLPTLENADQLIILDGGQVQSDMHERSTESQDNQ